MQTAAAFHDLSISRAARGGGLFLAFTLYVALAAAATIVFPPLGAGFLIPIALAILAAGPRARAIPRRLPLTLIFIAAFLLPVWPVWLHLSLGPLPILTPPRLILYLLSGLWACDMAASPFRRAQFALAVRRSKWVTGLVFGLFGLGLLSLPFAEGRSIAIPEFFRQAIIWLVPYCAVLTYVRRQREFAAILKILAAGAAVVAAIAIIEAAKGELLASVLSPLIADDAEWLINAQAEKVRDGAFRAQASHTHPLSLGEHLALSAPLAFAFLLTAKTLRARALWSLALLLIIAGALATGSRGAMLETAIALTALSFAVAFRALKRASASKYRPLAGLAVLLMVAASPIAAVGAYAVISGKGGESAANSTQSRVDQIEQAWPKIAARPVLGYGSGRAARILGYWGRMLTIDNYYLTLALELGLPGPLVFFTLIGAFGAASVRRAQGSHSSLGVLYAACFSAAAAFAISRSVSSQTGNLAIFYLMVAAFAGAQFSRRRSRNRL